MPINVSLCTRFVYVRIVLRRLCTGLAAAPENKNPPVRIASGGCVVSDVKGGVGGSRFGCRDLCVRIPIPDGGRRRLCIVPSVANGHLLRPYPVCGRRRCAGGLSAAPFDPARNSRAQSCIRAGLLTRPPPCAFPTDGSVASCTTLPPQRRNSQQRVLFRLRTGFPFNPVLWTGARTLQRYIFSA